VIIFILRLIALLNLDDVIIDEMLSCELCGSESIGFKSAKGLAGHQFRVHKKESDNEAEKLRRASERARRRRARPARPIRERTVSDKNTRTRRFLTPHSLTFINKVRVKVANIMQTIWASELMKKLEDIPEDILEASELKRSLIKFLNTNI